MGKTNAGKWVLYIGALVITLSLTAGGCFYLKAKRAFQTADTKIQEEILIDNLTKIRSSIKRYTVEKGAPPQSLSELVTSGYLPYILRDPVTKQQDWQVEIGDYETKSGKQRGIVNVHSWSNQKSSLGTPYNQW
jgi:hypothetical protein